MTPSVNALREGLAAYDQEHVLRYWDDLSGDARENLAGQIAAIDLPLTERLVNAWVRNDPPPEVFNRIDPVPTIPVANAARKDAQEAWDAGEAALRAGRVGMLLVAGGQGTRLGYDGPKGAYPVGPITGRSLFAYHADKILHAQRKYDCVLPWYIMVSDTNREETRAFFKENEFFGLRETDVYFFTQRMVPCVDDRGKFMLDEPGNLAMNPNGHGGVIPAVVENGMADDAKQRGVDTLSYFQVDNWALKVADPYFIGYHILGKGQMSSKIHRKTEVRESVGVHCLCDGEYRTIEYSELDIYPQLLETDAEGHPVYYAGNPAIHMITVGFIEDVFSRFESFPWHRAHKKIPYINESGERVEPEKPNGYKFETFVFDALRFTGHDPIALEIDRAGEYTPIKQFSGANSVEAARESQSELWARWLEAAGYAVPRDADGKVTIQIEISPQFAFSQHEFVERARNLKLKLEGDLAIGPDGEVFAKHSA
ncbi:MAG: UTP--glucose-1-phosphate uridylyltransferase [Candidatus Hydrogenedentes bacterium]|nr:UTP--glucose-1-phosphate uridylyltransferase [Candidatus Hydrogenedentota bacterium]